MILPVGLLLMLVFVNGFFETDSFKLNSATCISDYNWKTAPFNKHPTYSVCTTVTNTKSRTSYVASSKSNLVTEPGIGQLDQFKYTAGFLSKAALIGILTGLSVVLFKSSIEATQIVFYENLADYLPKPSFYWPLALYPSLGGIIVAVLTYAVGPKITNGIDVIAQ